ncbi:MAG: transposase [Terrimicrobiaceae bacterium]
MARKARVEYAGAVYHVMCRGDRKENIFEDAGDYRRFIETMGQVCNRTGWRIHAYVLMPNHYHWLLETPQPNLVAGMRWFQTTYTVRFNKRHGKVGHVFQGRYKAILVDSENGGYFRTLSDYIHLNPARAGLLEGEDPLANFRWSSLPHYLSPPTNRPSWLEVHSVLGEMGLRDCARDRKDYELQMEKRAKESQNPGEFQPLREGWVLGDDDFRDRIFDLMKEKKDVDFQLPKREETDSRHCQRHAEELILLCQKKIKITNEEMTVTRKGDWRKRILAHVVRRKTSVSLEWLGERLKMGTPGYLSRISSHVDDLASRSEWLWVQKHVL